VHAHTYNQQIAIALQFYIYAPIYIMLYLIGLGLCDEKDITVKGLEAIKECDQIFLEGYTSILGIDKEKLEKFYGKAITIADRETVESNAEVILDAAKTFKVAFLVVGDPFGATTHTDIALRAKQENIPVQVIHNASIMNAVASCGLQLYAFGQAVSIVFFTPEWRPDSFYDKIKVNRLAGLHTLCLLDIKVKEQSTENLLRGRKIYEPPRYMSINTCISQLLEIEEKRKEEVYTASTKCFGLARVGHHTDQLIVSGTMEELLHVDFGPPLHTFVICGEMHFIEKDYYDLYHVSCLKNTSSSSSASHSTTTSSSGECS